MVMGYRQVYKEKYQGMMFRVLQDKQTGKYKICHDFLFNLKYLYELELNNEQAAIDLISPDLWRIHIWHFNYKQVLKLL